MSFGTVDVREVAARDEERLKRYEMNIYDESVLLPKSGKKL